MDTAALISQIDRLKEVVANSSANWTEVQGARAQVAQFMTDYAGPNSSFLKLVNTGIVNKDFLAASITSALDNFRAYVEAGLHEDTSPIRKAQLDVVSDFLDQANTLLGSKSVHPAAPIVLIGATLEEFLRTWIEAKGLSLGQRKASIEAYAQVLLGEGLITKQDMKDITAWNGLRNHAAHGEWTEVTDKQRASIMLDGVNLFMRKYGA